MIEHENKAKDCPICREMVDEDRLNLRECHSKRLYKDKYNDLAEDNHRWMLNRT